MRKPQNSGRNVSSGKPKSLYRALAIDLLVLVSLASLAVNLLNYAYFTREAEVLYENKSSEYGVHLREALEWPLWNLDDELIHNIGDAFASNAEIALLIIRDDQRRVVYQYHETDGNLVKREIAIEHNGQKIGTVEIGLTMTAYQQRDRQLLLASLAAMVLLIVVLLAAVGWLLSRLLRKPIDALVAATGDMVEGKYRQIELPETYKEFSSILAGFKTMSDAVANRESSLQQINAQLSTEIGERKQAEENLRESEERLNLAARAGNIGVWDWNVVTNELIWEQSMYELYGIRKDDFGGAYDAWARMLHPDDKPFVEGEIQAALRGEREYAPEFRISRTDGTVRFIKAASKTYFDAQGKPLRMIGTNIDISERKQAEEQLRAASQYTRSLIEASLDPLVTISPEGKITDVNRATEKVTGRNRVELIGTDFSDYFTEPDKAREGYQQVFQKGFVTDYPLAIRHQSGHITDVLYNASVYHDEAGKVLGVFAAARDITERHAAEQEVAKLSLQNRLILEAAGEGIYGLNNDGRCTFANPAAAEWLGFSVEELLGQNSHALIHHTKPDGQPYPAEECPVQAAYKQGVVHRGGDLYWRKDGSSFPVEFVSTPILEAGKTTGAVVIFSDITERQRAEEELRRYKDHLEEKVQQRTADLVLACNAAETANKAKSVFLASMSHELRTPLNAILGFSSMMRKDAQLTQEQCENLDIINRSGEHLLTLINDVLEMAKIEAGRVQLENAPFDLGALVRDVTDMMHIRAQEKGLQLLVDQDSEFPRYINGDQARLRQILINLVGNAIKFTQQGGVTVRLGVIPHAVRQRLLIEVEDSGIGIKPEDRQRIFEPFVQLGQAALQKGTGLGLTITRQFVQLMGGTISVESTLGSGTTFRVELPVEEAAAADAVKPDSAGQGEIVGLAPNQPEYRILIVEDQLENQLLLVRLMKNIGFPFKVAENGEQGVALFQDWHPQLIWMDRRMPVMDGMEATRRIRELPGGKEVKIVAVTASAFKEQRDEMLNAGMDDFVRKPYRFNEIYGCLAKQLGVQFIYAGAQEEAAEVALTAEMLLILPPELRRELRDALESLEDKRIAAVLQQIASYDAALYKILSHLTANFDYPAILRALQIV